MYLFKYNFHFICIQMHLPPNATVQIMCCILWIPERTLSAGYENIHIFMYRL